MPVRRTMRMKSPSVFSLIVDGCGGLVGAGSSAVLPPVRTLKRRRCIRDHRAESVRGEAARDGGRVRDGYSRRSSQLSPTFLLFEIDFPQQLRKDLRQALGEAMRLGTVFLFGGALLIYAVSQHSNRPAPITPVTLAEIPAATAVVDPPKPVLGNQGQSRAAASPAAAPLQSSPAKPAETSTAKRTAEVLTAAAIAALIVRESRNAYYATGHPCACPDDTMRNGRACGGRSAYSRPGGAAPLCSARDVTEAMIKSFRSRVAER